VRRAADEDTETHEEIPDEIPHQSSSGHLTGTSGTGDLAHDGPDVRTPVARNLDQMLHILGLSRAFGIEARAVAKEQLAVRRAKGNMLHLGAQHQSL
jgi:hypothetical protein